MKGQIVLVNMTCLWMFEGLAVTMELNPGVWPSCTGPIAPGAHPKGEHRKVLWSISRPLVINDLKLLSEPAQ